MILESETNQNRRLDLIFVTDITDYICGENLSCGEIADFCKEFEQFIEFYRNLCRFCSKSV